MSNINVTVELCSEDRARLDKILEALSGGKPAPMEPTPAPTPEEAPKAEVKETPAPEPEIADPINNDLPWGEAEKPAEEVTAEAILAKVQQLAAPGTGKRDACKKIITQYAANVSGIPADKRGEVMQQLLELEKSEG